MALSVALITGHGEDDHITSFDARAFNRSVFGKGKYILQDAENLKVQVSALTGTIQISAGSCMWSGMHIRVEEDGAITYTTPASTDYVYVWLHYTRNPENLIESVEFTTTSGAKPEMELIRDNLTDDTTEAYTLFCSFTHDTSTNTVQGLTSDFAFRSALDDTAKSMSSSVSSLQANVSSQFGEMSENIGKIPAQVIQGLSGVTALGSSQLDGWIKFDESIYNFAFLLVVVSRSGASYAQLLPMWWMQESIPISSAFQTNDSLCAVSFTLTPQAGAVVGRNFGVSTYYAYRHVDSGALGGGYNQIEIPRSEIRISAYGIGRIKEA